MSISKTVADSSAASILAARSFKRLASAWPEGRRFYEQRLNAETTRGTALSVPFAAINATLGLPAGAPVSAE